MAGKDKPVVDKLGLKSGMTIMVFNPPGEYGALIGGVPDDVEFVGLEGVGVNLIHLFARERSGLETKLDRFRDCIAANGMIWVSWPKQASELVSDVSEDVVRQAGLAAGLVDVKVCSVDDTWSALKLVIPVKDRKKI